MNEMQEVIDSLAARVQRSVTVDDARLRVLAYSVHADQVDPMRTSAILRKITPPDSAEWLTGLGIEQAREPMRLPGNEELGQLPRICAPIRRASRLHGYLWLIDADESISDVELADIGRAADALADVLDRHARSEAEVIARRLSLGLQLVSQSSERAEAAAAELDAAGAFVPSGRMTVTTARFHPQYAYPGPEVVDDALIHASRLVRPRHAFWFRDGRDCVLVTSHPSGDAAAHEPLPSAQALHDLLSSALSESPGDPTVTVGIGEPVTRPSQLCRSARQARQSCDVGRIVAGLGPICHYRDLGPYRLIGLVSGAQRDDLHPGVVHLLEAAAHQLIATLEAYLDTGCDAPATAAALFIHRTTLYYRLDRIKELLGSDPTAGDQRLAVHMSIKAARLWGLLDENAPAS